MDAESFIDRIERNLAARKKELSAVKIGMSALRAAHNDLNSWTYRAAALLAYAHWEGFVKNSAEGYLDYIGKLQISTGSLKHCLQTSASARHLKRINGSSKIDYLGEILSAIDTARSETFSVNPRKIVSTEGNLSSVVLKSITSTIGIEYLDIYTTRSGFIDESLVGERNMVAHGELKEFDQVQAMDRIEKVIELLDTFAMQIIQAVRDEEYLAADI